MQRLNDFSMPMTEIGQWARVRAMVNDEEVEGIVAKTSNRYLCYATNTGFLGGSNQFIETSGWGFVTSEFNYGWTINVCNIGNGTFQEIFTSRGFDISSNVSLVGIINEQGQLVTSSGTITSVEVVRSEYEFMYDKYTKTLIYSGIHGYHHHHGVTQNAPVEDKRGHKIGVELEIEFNNSSLKYTWGSHVRSNWFYCERDGSLSDTTGVEIITVPMLPKDIKSRTTWEPLIGFLVNKAKAWDSSRCGLHVHIGREILGANAEQQSETIGKLLYLYHHFVNGTTMNTRIFGRSSSYNEKDGKTEEGKAVATLGSKVLKIKDIKDKLKSGMINKSSSDRYFDINLVNTNTIEFRKGRGSIKVSRIIMVIEYCEMMCKYAKQAKWEEISREKFVEYIVANISKDSPLYRFFEAGERCDSSF